MTQNISGKNLCTVVSGSSYTGLYAVDGTWNIVTNDGTTLKGSQHPCGALNAVIVTDPSSPYYAPNGSINVITRDSGVTYTTVYP